MLRNCLYCNREFTVMRATHKFCSHPCSSTYVKINRVDRRKTKQCLNCKQEFKYSDSDKRDSGKVYCSYKCSGLGRSKIKSTKECKKAAKITNKYSNIKVRATKLGVPFCTKEQFIEWHINQNKNCFYCDIPLEIWELLYSGHQNKFSLSIDRKDGDLGYTPFNMVFACSQCNIIKNNILTSSEMREIAQKYIKPKWESKINGGIKCIV